MPILQAPDTAGPLARRFTKELGNNYQVIEEGLDGKPQTPWIRDRRSAALNLMGARTFPHAWLPFTGGPGDHHARNQRS